MLVHDMLAALADGGIHSTAELARRLGVHERLVIAMADDLNRRGYLASPTADCAAACGGCSLASACTVAGRSAPRPIFLTLTAKGQRAAAARS